MGRISNSIVLEDSGVIPGTYSAANIVVNSKGIILSATDGSGGGGGGVTEFNDLTDVNVTGVTTDQVVKFNGSLWVPDTLNIDDLGDTNVSAPQVGDVLSWSGTQWFNKDLSTAGILLTSDIDVTVQAWGGRLDGLSAMGDGEGYVVQTSSTSFAKRLIQVEPSAGLTVTNSSGVSGNTVIGLDITTTPLEGTFDVTNDLLIFYDDSVSNERHASISDIVTAASPISGVTSVGAGASIIKQIEPSTRVLELRSIDNTNTGIVITSDANTVLIGVSDNLQNLSDLVPVTDGFIVGDGSGNWSVETGATTRTSLGLGTMATETASDYLLLAGGTMSGQIDMDSIKIVSLGDPTTDFDAAHKKYVDDAVGAGAVAGAGMTQTGPTFDVVNIDGSITVNPNDIELNTAFTDALYYTQTELSSDGEGIEGAALIGTDIKTGLNNATDVETALTYINTELPWAVQRYRAELTGIWNLDVGAPNVQIDTVHDVEVARFVEGDDIAIYKDLMLSPDFDTTRALHFYAMFAKETSSAGQVDMALAFQHQRIPGFGANDVVSFSPTNTDRLVLEWVLPTSFLALDLITLRLTRLGSGDTYTTGGADFFGAYIIQE